MSAAVRLAGQDYPLVWGTLARVRYSGVAKSHRDLGGAAQQAVFLWCAIAQKPNPFETWEHLAEQMDQADTGKYTEAIIAVLPAPATEEKKTTSETSPSPG